MTQNEATKPIKDRPKTIKPKAKGKNTTKNRKFTRHKKSLFPQNTDTQTQNLFAHRQAQYAAIKPI